MFFQACLFEASSLSVYSSVENHCSTMLWLNLATYLQVSWSSTELAPTSCLVSVRVSLTESNSVWRSWTVGEQLLFFYVKDVVDVFEELVVLDVLPVCEPEGGVDLLVRAFRVLFLEVYYCGEEVS